MPRTHESTGLITYTVTLSTPQGEGVIDVPSFLGSDAAGRRAVVAAMASGWGDFDAIKVVSIVEGDQ